MPCDIVKRVAATQVVRTARTDRRERRLDRRDRTDAHEIERSVRDDCDAASWAASRAERARQGECGRRGGDGVWLVAPVSGERRRGGPTAPTAALEARRRNQTSAPRGERRTRRPRASFMSEWSANVKLRCPPAFVRWLGTLSEGREDSAAASDPSRSTRASRRGAGRRARRAHLRAMADESG